MSNPWPWSVTTRPQSGDCGRSNPASGAGMGRVRGRGEGVEGEVRRVVHAVCASLVSTGGCLIGTNGSALRHPRRSCRAIDRKPLFDTAPMKPGGLAPRDTLRRSSEANSGGWLTSFDFRVGAMCSKIRPTSPGFKKSSKLHSMGAKHSNNSFCVLLISMVLTGCKPSIDKGPPPQPRVPSGHVALTFTGATASTIDFLLDNRSGHAMSIRVSHFRSYVEPWDTTFSCYRDSDHTALGTGFPPLDYDFHPIDLEVGPDDWLRVQLPRDVVHVEGRCTAILSSLGGDKITSDEFTL